MKRRCRLIQLAFEQTLRRAVELGFQTSERTPWARAMRTFQQLLSQKRAPWTFLEHPGIEPTNNTAAG